MADSQETLDSELQQPQPPPQPPFNALAGFQNPARAQASLPLDAIDAAAARYGLNPAVLKGIASIESSMDPESNRNRGTQYKGLFQIGQDEWKRYGRGDIYNPADNADAAARMLADHAQWFAGQKGREPTPGDLYMMHLQGRGFIRNGTMTNVAGNPYPGMRGPQTPETFAQGWTSALTRRMAPFGGADSIYAGAGQAPAPSLPAPVNVAPPPGGVASAPQSSLAPPTGGVQAALAGLGSPSSGGGTFADIGKSLMAQAGKTKGLPFPDAKLRPFDENLRPLPLNLPANFAALAQIPRFAEGGVVDRPTVAMVGENGPEAIVPLRPMGMAQPDVIGNRIGAIPAVHNFMSDLLTALKDRAVSTATAPLRALTGQMQVTDPETGMPTPEAMREAQGVAGAAMTGGMPFAQRGSAGIFGGRLAKGANLSELEAAQTFAAHGAHPDDIWKSTGWFQGADAKWRHEIPDTLAQFDKGAPDSGKLPELLTEHPLLYAAYPELKDANYQMVPGTSSSYVGRNPVGQHEFEIGENTFMGDPSVVLHEIQHAIQGKEGFAKGGSPERGPFSTPFDAELEPLMKERIALIRKYANPGGVEPVPLTPKENERLDYLNKVGETHGRLQRAYNQEAFRNYQRIAGETEARNVQHRWGMGESVRHGFEQDLGQHPQMTESFPRSEQIVSERPFATGPKMVRDMYGKRMLENTERGFDPFSRPPPPDFRDAFERLLAGTRGGSSGSISPRSEPERIGFRSAGAQRDPGKVSAERQPVMETPEAMAKRKAEMKAAFDELMKKGRPEKTKAAPGAPGRIGFKSLGTER